MSACVTTEHDLVEVASYKASNDVGSHDFFRQAQWSPDGTLLLANTESHRHAVYHLSEVHLNQKQADEEEARAEPIELKLEHRAPSPIHSCCLYPLASLYAPTTACFATSSVGRPIHLVDAMSGHTRASYPIIDHQEKFRGAAAMKFSSDGLHLVCGHENSLEVFDVTRPGPGSRICTSQYKKSGSGQKGIISTLDFSREDTSNVLVAGSFSGQMAIYDLRSASAVLHFTCPSREAVSQVEYHPNQPGVVFSSHRKSTDIQAWDLRFSVNQLGIYARGSCTNQRLGFSFASPVIRSQSAEEQTLIAGDQVCLLVTCLNCSLTIVLRMVI